LCDAPWDEVAASLSNQTILSNQTSLSSQTSPTPADPAETNEAALIAALLAACRIPPSGPQMGVSLKPYVLLFDEYYTDLYRMTEAERWMNSASRMVFMGTSFSVNITAIALRTAVQRGIPVEIVDPEPIDLAASFGIPAGMAEISYHAMTAEAWVQSQG
jgi:NAD-dependent deacetylase